MSGFNHNTVTCPNGHVWHIDDLFDCNGLTVVVVHRTIRTAFGPDWTRHAVAIVQPGARGYIMPYDVVHRVGREGCLRYVQETAWNTGLAEGVL